MTFRPHFVPTRVLTIAVLVALGCSSGCGSGAFEVAPVSGVVTLNGKPLENAAVRFSPQRKPGETLVGPGSLGITDGSGKFVAKTHAGQRGAVVGPHVVSISTYDERLVDPENSDRIEVVSKERVPQRYRSPSELTFEVPNGGSEEANFDLATTR